MPPLHNHTHCQVAQKSLHTNQNLSKSMAALTHELTVEDKALKHNIVYSAFGGSYKGFGLFSFTQLCNCLISKCLESPNDTIHEER